MRIISTTDLSRGGNDCYIYESVSLIEEFGMYAVVTCTKTTGWSEREYLCIEGDPMTNIEDAKQRYWEYGGKLNAVQE